MRGIFSYINSFTLFPGLCLCCGLPSNRKLDLCSCCEQDLPRLRFSCTICAVPLAISTLCGECQKDQPAFSKVVTPFSYQPPISNLIIAFKHHNDLVAGKLLAQLLADHLQTILESNNTPDLIIPVPLHWRKRCRRGFNQAWEVARYIGEKTAIPVSNRLVFRERFTTSQQGLHKHQRHHNLRNAFITKRPLKDLHIAVVDDVVTTASTANAIAHTLKKAGASYIEIWCIARTPLEKKR